MFEKSIFSVVATPASSILIRSSKKKKKQKKTKKTENKQQTLCPVTVLVDSQVSDCCPCIAKQGYAEVYLFFLTFAPKQIVGTR